MSKQTELRVIFDTSVVHYESSLGLLNNRVARLLTNNAEYPGLSIKWYLPDIVRHERRYQMINQAKSYMANFRKIEKLLDQAFDVNEKLIESRIDQIIDKNIHESHIELITLDTNRVDWERIINNALYRQPPFSQGETEKGFRDALIAECFFQFAEDSISSLNQCQVVLAVKDDLLSKSIKERAANINGVHLPCDIDGVQELINSLVSQVSESFIEDLRPIAERFFYQPALRDTLYYRYDIEGLINGDNAFKQSDVPSGTRKVVIMAWIVEQPTFIKKSGNQFTWNSKVRIEKNAYTERYVLNLAPSGSTGYSPPLGGSPVPISPSSYSGGAVPFSGIRVNPPFDFGQVNYRDSYQHIGATPLPLGPYEILIARGSAIFDVMWSATYKDEQFSEPKLESLQYSQTIWQEA